MGSIQGFESFSADRQFAGILRDSTADPLFRLLQRALTSTGASGAAIALLQDGGIVTRASAGQSAPPAGSHQRLTGGFTGLCLRTAAMLRCDDAETDQRVNAAACRALGARSIVAIPVRDGDQVRGVFEVFAARPSAFSIPHVGVLKTIAVLLGEALRQEEKKERSPASHEIAAGWQPPLPPPATAPPEAIRTPPVTLKAPPVAVKTPSGVQEQKPVSRSAPASFRYSAVPTPTLQSSALPTPAPAAEPASPTILRFLRSERLLHWSIAIPFMVCFVTALILLLVYNPHPQRPLRFLFAWIHRISGLCLAVLPLLTLLRHRHEYKTHLGNIKCGWTWALDDFKWLLLMGPATLCSRISLPDQGKFNAAEKLNFMMVMTGYPLFTTTGIFLFLPGIHFLPWLAHVAMALLATPLMLGHIFMATVNPATRVGLQGMISGYVDRHWAKHHYARWYRENFEQASKVRGDHRLAAPQQNSPPTRPCPSCRERASRPAGRFAILGLQSVICPVCGAEAPRSSA